MSLTVDCIAKRFGSYEALKDVSFTAPQGAFVTLLGPSGSGKTTLLRILGGLEFPDSGTVRFADLNWLGVPARQRRAGFVFQQYALFRHMIVAKNIAFGLSVRPRKERPARAEIRRRVDELLSLVQLEGLGERYPSQLSGGQQQRVALARARHRTAHAAAGRTVRGAGRQGAQGTSRVAARAARTYGHNHDPAIW